MRLSLYTGQPAKGTCVFVEAVPRILAQFLLTCLLATLGPFLNSLPLCIPQCGLPLGKLLEGQWALFLSGQSSLTPCTWDCLPSLPLPWGPGSLPHPQPLLLFPSEAPQNIQHSDSSSDSGGVYFCSHVLLPGGLGITAVTFVCVWECGIYVPMCIRVHVHERMLVYA